MIHNYPEYILKKLRGNEDLEDDDTSKDSEFQKMEPDEVFDICCNWEGLIRHGPMLRSWVQSIYGVNLSEQPKVEIINGEWYVLVHETTHKDDEYLLCFNPFREMRYVTWYRRTDDPKSTCYGHYYSSIIEAVLDYNKRIHLAKYGEE